jgi:hypothetical protein
MTVVAAGLVAPGASAARDLPDPAAMVAYTQRATSTRVTGLADLQRSREVTRRCVCTNRAEYRSASRSLGVNALNEPALKRRLGASVGHTTYVSMVATTAQGAPRLKRVVPFPDYNSKSRKKYRRSLYYVYEIVGVSRGPLDFTKTWKFGITRQADPNTRPKRQLPACNRHWTGQPWFFECGYTFRWRGLGWFRARTVEANYTLYYALSHHGRCPPGMPRCL